jgi:[ribosomal protein S5]-alanine N-acetyltransferase
MLGPILRGENITLEPPEPEDLPIFRAWFAELEVTQYLIMRFVPSISAEEEFYQHQSASANDLLWKIVAGGKTIGTTGISAISWINRNATTGLLIGDPAEWGKGYASETVRLRTAYAFNELGLERLSSESFVDNLPMHRALEKSGYQNIGRARHVFFKGGRWHDVYLFEVLRHEWLALMQSAPAQRRENGL